MRRMYERLSVWEPKSLWTIELSDYWRVTHPG